MINTFQLPNLYSVCICMWCQPSTPPTPAPQVDIEENALQIFIKSQEMKIRTRFNAIPREEAARAVKSMKESVDIEEKVVQKPGQEPLTATMLATAPPQEQKQMLGERLFPLIQRMYPDLAGKITGMLLEIDNAELLHMLEDGNSLKSKVIKRKDFLEISRLLYVSSSG